MWILLIVWSAWAVMITWYMRKVLNKELAYLDLMPINENIKCPGAARYDAIGLNHWSIYLNAIFLMPIKLCLGMSLFVFQSLVCITVGLIYRVSPKNNQSPRGRIYNLLSTGIFTLLVNTMLFCFGITTQKRKLRIRDLLPGYTSKKAFNNPAIVISNHVSFLEIFYFMGLGMSFLSKKSVSKIPLMGPVCTTIQSIYVDRDSEEARKNATEAIQARVSRIERHGDMLPLLVFPEGTTSNGRTVLKFKRGAFETNTPLKIFSVRFESSSGVLPATVGMTTLQSILLLFTTTNIHMHVNEFEDLLDPEWVYTTQKVNPSDEHAWEKVAEVAKHLISKTGGFYESENSFREICEFEKEAVEKWNPK